jgi:hypothetical protein
MTEHAEGIDRPDPLLDGIAHAAEGLFITSETDSPLTPFRWPDFFTEKSDSQDAAEALRKYKKLPEDTELETVSLERFFKSQIEPAEGDDKEIAEEKRRLAELRDLLAKELQETAVYRSGKINITAYVLGRVPGTRDAAGVSAELVET